MSVDAIIGRTHYFFPECGQEPPDHTREKNNAHEGEEMRECTGTFTSTDLNTFNASSTICNGAAIRQSQIRSCGCANRFGRPSLNNFGRINTSPNMLDLEMEREKGSMTVHLRNVGSCWRIINVDQIFKKKIIVDGSRRQGRCMSRNWRVEL